MKTIIKIGIMTYGRLNTHISHLTRLARMSMQILRRDAAMRGRRRNGGGRPQDRPRHPQGQV